VGATIYGSFDLFRLHFGGICLCLCNKTYYIPSGTVFRGEFSGGHHISQQLPFLEGGGIIHHQRLFFEHNSVVAVAGCEYCLFRKVISVIYDLGSFFKQNLMVAVAKCEYCLFRMYKYI